MALVQVTHAKVVTIPDDHESQVGSDEWNAAHAITGLENVDNTADVNKPVSTAQAAAIAAGVAGVTKASIGLGSVDNTSDANKPVSTAQAAANASVAATAANATNLTSGTIPAARLPALTGDVTTTAGTVATVIGATKVTSAMLNADVFSTAHTWGGQQTFVSPVLGAAAATSLTSSGQVISQANGGGPAGAFLASAASPAYTLQATGQAADQKVWDSVVFGTALNFRAVNDANSVANAWMTVTRGAGATVAGISITPQSATLSVKPYDGVTQTGVSALSIANGDSSALTATERYTAWVSNTSAGTGDGSVAGTTYALGASAIKANWQSSGVAGQMIGLLVTARGGYNNVVNNGDTAGINANVGASFSNNLSQQFEGVSGYYPAGSTTGSVVINTQIGSIRATGLGDVGNNVSYGYFAQAQNGTSGVAFGASNLKASPKFGNAATWGYFLKYDNDDGVHTPYTSFAVSPAGALTIAGFGTAGTNQKTIRVGGSATNNLEIVNGASSALIFSMTDTGLMQVGPGSTTANGAVATAMSSVGPTGSHTAIQEWFTLQNSSGVTRYIPAF